MNAEYYTGWGHLNSIKISMITNTSALSDIYLLSEKGHKISFNKLIDCHVAKYYGGLKKVKTYDYHWQDRAKDQQD